MQIVREIGNVMEFKAERSVVELFGEIGDIFQNQRASIYSINTISGRGGVKYALDNFDKLIKNKNRKS